MWWFLSVAFGGSAFYPGVGPETVAVAPDGTVGGWRRAGVVLARLADPESLRGRSDVAGWRVLRATVDGAVVQVAPAPGVDDVALSLVLRDLPGTAWAHPDLVVPLVLHTLPDDPYLESQWHLQNVGQYGYTPGVDIHAEEAWAITRGAGQRIAIVDSGVDLDHPDLSVIDGYDFVGRDPSSDEVGEPHGTACAGLAAARGDNGVGLTGVAWEAEIYASRLIGGATTLSDVYEAIAQAVDAGASVVSNSWGWSDGCPNIASYGVLTDAFQYAENQGREGLGSAVVFAAGNGNCDITGDGMLADDRLVVVSAVSGFDVRESYSSFGPWVDVAAPSGNMATTDIVGGAGYNGFPGDDAYTAGFNGTSASTPVVAGVLALMFAANDRLTAAQARAALCASAVQVDLDGGAWDDAGFSPYYGCGRVDAGAAVRAVANLGPPPAPVPIAETVAPDAAVLRWTQPADPDGEPPIWTVRWALTTDPWPREQVTTTQPWLDLTGQVADGETVVWQVLVADGWGETDWTPDVETPVVAPVAPPAALPPVVAAGGCATAIGAGWLPIAAAVLSARARRARGR